ncbi:MAG: ABC transporter ATP-binding protein [Bacteroidales bacterium]|nr:ABC transporter ATP-binding protein [Bacteroidales bacterium]
MKYVRWFIRAVRPYWIQLTLTMLCHVLIAGCAIGFVYVSKKLVDVAVAILSGRADAAELTIWAFYMAGIAVSRILLNALRSYLQTTTEIRLKNSLRRRIFDILLHLQSDGVARHHSGDVLNRMQEDVRLVSAAFVSSIPNLAGTLLQFSAALIFLIILDLRLAVLIVIIVPAGLLIGKFITARIRNLTMDIRKSDSKVQAHLQESLQHITLLQSLEYTDSSSSALDGLQGSLYGNEVRRTKFSVISRICMSLALQAGHVMAFLWGVTGISHGTVTYGMMTAFLQLVGQIQRPLVEMGSQLPLIIHATSSIDRLIELEALPREDEEEPRLSEGVVGIRMDGVTFSYPDSSRNVLDDFSWDFKPGSRTAIVGPTGVGKSTMIRLMLSLLRPQKGKVLLYSSYEEAESSPATRCNIVYVPQGNSLFSGTVRDNLLMGNPEASDEQLSSALHVAAADFVFDLPQGLDTQCFESGAGLSEGQAQRVAIARALLRPGSILLLDEFSSALDAETENVLLERLTSSLPDHTMIFITHRDKIIDYCDSVLRLA